MGSSHRTFSGLGPPAALAASKQLGDAISSFMVIYIKSFCPWCKEALAWLDQHGYRYEVREVLEDPEAMARMREISGQSLTPTMEVGGKVLADFDTGQLSDFLDDNGIKP
jgi:glutaredoxin 3